MTNNNRYVPNQSLQNVRKLRRWTQRYMAEQLGIPDPSLISDWERGIHIPSLEYQRKLCEFFGLSAEELGFIPPKELPSPDQPAAESTDTIEEQRDEEKDDKRRAIGLPSRRMLLMILIGSTVVAATGGGTWWVYSREHQSKRVPVRSWPTVVYDPSSTKLNVKVIQWLLQAHSYDPGPADGIFGPTTLEAVRAFQAGHQLPITGTVENRTWEQLVTISSTGVGSGVHALQELLNASSAHPHLQVDGIFGPKTGNAVVQYQQQHHLPTSGEADLDTWCLLVGGSITT